MVPSFAMIHWIARDQEEEIRREAAQYYHLSVARTAVGEPRLPARLAILLRHLADRLDPEPVCN